MSYAPPAPPLANGELTFGLNGIRATIERGRMGACCMCSGTCFTWWSAAPPSAYVPLHENCAPRLLEHWHAMMADGDVEPERVFVPPSGRRGAYARRAASVPEGEHVVVVAPVRSATGAMLPEGFTPGPFWQPGDDENTPWNGLLETATGLTLCPAGANREHAEKTFRFYETQRLISMSTVVVGGAVIAPDGSVAMSWGSVPSPDGPRWAAITSVGEWRRCPGCNEVLWPGCWVTVAGGFCQACQSTKEADDPREWPVSGIYPGDQHVPDSFGAAKKVTLPSSARLKPTLSRGRFTSRRKSG